MDKQTIFTKVATHLLTQNKQALRTVSMGTTCAYRGNDGTSCAIGCLIPDDKYDPLMEGSSIDRNPRVLGVLSDIGIDTADQALNTYSTYALLDSLQSIHDGYLSSSWRGKLAKLAWDHKLLMPEVYP